MTEKTKNLPPHLIAATEWVSVGFDITWHILRFGASATHDCYEGTTWSKRESGFCAGSTAKTPSKPRQKVWSST